MNPSSNHGQINTDINTSSDNLEMSLTSINDLRINEERNPYQNDSNNQNQNNNLQNNNNDPNQNINNQNQNNNNNQNQNNNLQNNNNDPNQNINNQNQNNNNNQNQNNNLQNNLVQPNNNGFQLVDIHMIRISNPNKDEQCRIFHGDPIKTNNSIAIWYALKTTMHYLRKRGELKGTNLITKLDLAAKNNLKSISKYLQECTIDNQVTKDIGELAKAFGNIENRNENGNRVRVVSHVNENNISNIVNKYKAPKQSIEDLVLDGLTKEKTKIEDPKDLLAKHDFDDLKGTIQTGDEARDEKVFLSKAAKEFQNKVKDLKPVKEGNGQDQAIKNYNEAVKKLDEAIKSAIEKAIQSKRNSSRNGYVKSKIPDILSKLQLENNKNNIINNINQLNNEAIQPEQNVGDTNRVKNLTSLAIGDGVIQGENEKKLLSELSERIKEHLTKMDDDDDKQKYIQDVFGQSEEGDVWTNLKNCWAQRENLAESDRKKIKYDGAKIENDNKDNKKDDGLINIANDTKIKEITLEYDEYNNFVPSKLFYDANDINDAMKDFIETVLLGDPNSENCKKAKGDLKGMIEHININSKPDTNKDWIHYCSLHKDVNKVKEKDRKYFVPTFIENLFNTNSGDYRQNLTDNLNTLVEDKTFKTFLSNIMKNDLAVEMINKNVEQLDKAFKDEDYKTSRRRNFNEEFWDNNFKGHLPFCGQWKGRVMKNLAMLTGEAAGGIALGKTIAGIFALGTAATWVTMAVTIIAVAVLVSLMIALLKGIGSKMKGEGFYEPSDDNIKSKKNAQIAFLNKIYTAFLTFGADEEQLKNLVAEINRKGLDKKSPQGKFFKSMVDMKDFLKKNASKYKETKGLVGDGTPFQKLKKILEEKKQPPAQNQNNENINIPQ